MYSPRFEQAITTMLDAHGLARRKAGRGYEVSHALAVAMILGDFGFDEDTCIAGLLHDTLEDTDLETGVIEARFGRPVLDMVQDVTEPPKPRPWRERKLQYLEQLRRTPRQGARAIAAADKIHNLSKMTDGLRGRGLPYVQPFSARLADMVWFHQQVLAAVSEGWTHDIVVEQVRRFDEFQQACDACAASGHTADAPRPIRS